MEAAVVTLTARGFNHPPAEWTPGPFVLAARERKVANVCVVAHEEASALGHVAAGGKRRSACVDVGYVNAGAYNRAARWKSYLLVVIVGARLQAGDLAWL